VAAVASRDAAGGSRRIGGRERGSGDGTDGAGGGMRPVPKEAGELPSVMIGASRRMVEQSAVDEYIAGRRQWTATPD
jgi:hypothetical protein